MGVFGGPIYTHRYKLEFKFHPPPHIGIELTQYHLLDMY